MITLFRKSTRSLLDIKFSDVGVNWDMSDEAIAAHVAAFYPGWSIMVMEESGKCRGFMD